MKKTLTFTCALLLAHTVGAATDAGKIAVGGIKLGMTRAQVTQVLNKSCPGYQEAKDIPAASFTTINCAPTGKQPLSVMLDNAVISAGYPQQEPLPKGVDSAAVNKAIQAQVDKLSKEYGKPDLVADNSAVKMGEAELGRVNKVLCWGECGKAKDGAIHPDGKVLVVGIVALPEALHISRGIMDTAAISKAAAQ
ncbi:hypothetical protein [uncultured Cardiobacterium sp.]|uniref:hypothetical protein n=1 Tax=uncultured Cardiobacterium sp. TaxID=417619 RepID=UPI00261C1A2C|nr:hypothetical protein [uncultured Cardiobacterium sp.]